MIRQEMYIYTRFIRIVIGVTVVGANTGREILADTAVTISEIGVV